MGNDMSTLDNRVGANRGMPQTYSFSVSETLQRDGASEQERVVQMTRAEMHSSIPMIAHHGGGFRSRQHMAIQNVSTQNVASLLNIPQLASREDTHLRHKEEQAEEQLARLVSDRDKLTGSLCVAITLGLVTQLLNGYNTAVLNALSLVVFPGHSTVAWAVAVGAFAIGGPVGSAVAGRCADSLGRRGALLACTNCFLFGGAMLALAPNMAVLTLGRFATGFSSGFSSVLVPIYMGELSPPSYRGFFGTCTQLALVGGILAASLLAFHFATEDAWRVMMAVTPALCALQLLFAPFLYESPRWLLERNPHSAQAAFALKQLYGLTTDREVQLEISHILHASSKHSTNPNSAASFNSFTMLASAANGSSTGSAAGGGGGGGGGGRRRPADVPKFDWTSGLANASAYHAKHHDSVVVDGSGKVVKSPVQSRRGNEQQIPATTAVELKPGESARMMESGEATAATVAFSGGGGGGGDAGMNDGTMPLKDDGGALYIGGPGGVAVTSSTPKVRSLTKPPKLGAAYPLPSGNGAYGSGRYGASYSSGAYNAQGGTTGSNSSLRSGGSGASGGTGARRAKTESESALAAMLADENVRPLVITAVVLHVSQQFCGINAVFYYSTDFFRGVIEDPLMGSTLVAAVNVLATMLATVLMDHMGRRPLMIVSSSGMILSTGLVVAALLGVVPKFVALAAVMGFVSFFEIGLGPIPWLIVAEMFDSKYVASAQSLACQINWFCNFIVGVGFPFLQAFLGPWSFLPFGIVLLACLCFVVQRMPETLNATENDIKYQVKLLWGVFDEVLRMDQQDDDIPHSNTELEMFQGKFRLQGGGSSGDLASHPFSF